MPASDEAAPDGQREALTVSFNNNDIVDPQRWVGLRKALSVTCAATATFAVALSTSALTGGLTGIMQEYSITRELALLAVSLFVLGLAVGPLLWAPLSERYGRRTLFLVTFGCSTAFNAGATASPNITSLLCLRLLAGVFGASSLPTCGGVIADLYTPAERGPASVALSLAPFLGPILGPLVGGFLEDLVGWRWIDGLISILGALVWLASVFFLHESYAPLLLRKEARKLSSQTGRRYMSCLEGEGNSSSQGGSWKKFLLRPFQLLLFEPIVLVIALYVATIYGILFMMFAAFPIIFQQQRHWTAGLSGLAFSGIGLGMILALVTNVFFDRRYKRAKLRNSSVLPEARLYSGLLAAIALPIGLFSFAWTNGPNLPWIICILGSAPFGFGLLLMSISLNNYLVDVYGFQYSASVLAAASVLRSLFGAVFPLFTVRMYKTLGTHWASSVPAFISLLCAPVPFLFLRYGAALRTNCRYAAEAHATMLLYAGSQTAEVEKKSSKITNDV